MKKLDNFCNSKISTRIRYWLIQKIAGKSVILLNAKIQLVPYDGEHVLHVDNVKGGYFENCHFPFEDGMVLHIQQMPKVRS